MAEPADGVDAPLEVPAPGVLGNMVIAARDALAPEQPGEVLKVLYLDDQGTPVGEWASSQLPENPFDGQMQGLQEPPYRMEQLIMLAESHPIHSAALEQKTADIVGKGFEWIAGEDDEVDDDAKGALNDWFEGLATGEEDMKEIIHAAWLDCETTGWGLLELARDPSGKLRQVYQVPAHTVRAHRNGFKLCQIRDNRKVWFKRWGAVDRDGKPIEVDARTGSQKTVRDPANDLFVIKRTARRSSWYGIPGYVSAIGWITLALAARDDNLFLFANRREPRWAIILSNLDQNNPNLEDQIRRAFTVDLRQPHRNIIIPIAGAGKIDFQKISADLKQDGSFGALSIQANREVMIAHRVPGERLANTEVGPLGGNIAEAANRVYKEAVVTPGQEVLQSRLNRLITVEYARETGDDAAAATAAGVGVTAPTTKRSVIWSVLRKAQGDAEDATGTTTYRLKLDDLDIETDREQLDLTVIAFHGDLITLGESRRQIGRELLTETAATKTSTDPITGETTTTPPPTNPETGAPYEEGEEYPSPLNDLLYSQLPGTAGTTGSPVAVPPGSGGLAGATIKSAGGDPATALLLADVREGIRQSREVQRQLQEMADAASGVDSRSSYGS